MAGRRLGRPSPGSSILFLCDMQERFRHSVAFFPQIVAVAARVLQGCRALGVPAVVTEQVPRVLGPTVPELGAHDLPKHPKTCFSMVVPAVEAELRARPHLSAALLCGIETQACVMQTALDLLERGLEVHVVVDACSSRSQVDRLVALGRLRQSGAFLTTSESLLLLLLRDSAHPGFRQVRPRPATPRHALPRPSALRPRPLPPPPPVDAPSQPLSTHGHAHSAEPRPLGELAPPTSSSPAHRASQPVEKPKPRPPGEQAPPSLLGSVKPRPSGALAPPTP